MTATVLLDADPGGPLAPLASGAPLVEARYQVLEHLHRSNVLDVYDVWSAERRCRCVAKVLRPDRRDRERDRARLVHEGHLLGRLTHPHIGRVYETIDGPAPVVVLETLGGATLEALLAGQRRRRLDVRDLAVLGLQLCSAMQYLHGQGHLHLDLKPSNVVAGEDGRARVIDLSLARPPGEIGAGVGTRMYLAPEQARGGWVGPEADVWGIGGVLWEAAMGRRAFGVREGAPPYPQLERRAETLRRRGRGGRSLGRLVDSCLDPEPRHRPPVADLADGLRALAG